MTLNDLISELRAAAQNNQPATYINTLMRKAAAALADQANSVPAEPVSRESVGALSSEQILEVFERNGFRIELGAQFSARGQIAQLLNAVGEIERMTAPPSPDAELVELIELVRAKIRSAGRCHPNAVEYLLAEALEAIDAKLASLNPRT